MRVWRPELEFMRIASSGGSVCDPLRDLSSHDVRTRGEVGWGEPAPPIAAAAAASAPLLL